MNKLNEQFKVLNQEGRIARGKIFNPKEQDIKLIGPLHPLYYKDYTGLDYEDSELEKIVIKRNGVANKEVDTSKFVSSRRISQQEAEKLCRCEFETIGFKSASMLKDINGVEVVEVITDYGPVMPITYPEEKSLCGIFTNADGDTAYVMTGRCKVINGKIYIPSINREAINKFVELKLENPRTRLSKILSNQLWQLDKEEKLENKEEILEKSIMWLSSCKYGLFPRMRNGEFYNTVWNETIGTSLYDIIENGINLQKYIRYSSLSQNGITAQAGPVEYEDGNMVISTVKQFNGTKGKLDISGTRGPKQYKQSNYAGRVLVALCAPTKGNNNMPSNNMGNVLVTKEAFDSYVTDFTRDLCIERKCGYPDHKIFVYTKDEVVRVKGAASFEDITAVLEDGTIENKVVLLPPVELNIKGKLEEDLDKFKYLCKVRDDKSHLQMVTINIYGKQYKVPALYCDIYEDCEHSSLSTSSIKPQNLFYYGGIMSFYQMNGKKVMREAISSMLDHKRINNVLNCIAENTTYMQKRTLSDFLNSL